MSVCWACISRVWSSAEYLRPGWPSEKSQYYGLVAFTAKANFHSDAHFARDMNGVNGAVGKHMQIPKLCQAAGANQAAAADSSRNFHSIPVLSIVAGLWNDTHSSESSRNTDLLIYNIA